MDYNDLLSAAQRNTEQMNSALMKRRMQQMNDLRRGPDPEAIARFKARKEREEQLRLRRAQQEKERLLTLRAQSSKSVRKAQMMKSRTKDNNFGKIETTDQDRVVEEKIRQKSIGDIKERMKARIDLEQQLNGLARKDREKVIKKFQKDDKSAIKIPDKKLTVTELIQQSKQQKSMNNGQSSAATVKSKPQPLSYDQLLNMAAQKSQQKVSLEEEIKSELEFQEKNLEKQRQKLLASSRAKQIESARSNKVANNKAAVAAKSSEDLVKSTAISKEPQRSKVIISNGKLPTTVDNIKASNIRQPQQQLQPVRKPSVTPSKLSKSIDSMRSLPPATSAKSSMRSSISDNRVMQQSKSNGVQHTSSASIRKNYDSDQIIKSKQQLQPKQPIRMLQSTNMFDEKSGKPILKSNTSPMIMKKPQLPQKSVITKTISNSSIDMHNRSRLQEKQLPQHRPPQQKPPPPPPPRPKLPPIGATYRRGIYDDYEPNDSYYDDDEDDEEEEMEDEYDDDMADFIDDGPIEQPDPEEEYSRHIREIFGYDKRKYRNVIEDDIEEASYGQVMKEEMRSLREGIREDLEDIRREEQEKRLKALQKKARMKGLKGY